MRGKEMTRACTLTFSAALLTLSLTPPASYGQQSSAAAEIRRLLSEAWDVTPTARALADEIYHSASSPQAMDELQRAYTLTLIKQRRYPEALNETRSLLGSSSDDHKLRWTEIWLLLVNRNYNAALERCAALAELAELRAAADLGQVPSETLVSLGAAIGFLEGPARESMTVAVMDQRIAKIMGRLNQTQLEALSLGRKNLLDDYTLRQQESQRANEEERQALENERQEKLAQLEQERLRVVEEEAQLDERQRELESEFREHSSRLRQQEADSNVIARDLADEAAFMRSRLVLLEADLARLDAEIAQTKDPAVRAILIAQYNNVARIHRLQVHDLRNVEVQLATANRNLAAARHERVRYQRQTEAARAAIRDSQNAVRKALLRVNRRLAELASPDLKETARSRAQRQKTGTWITYMPYPLEVERQRLLAAR
jgi:hypothetical protein